MTTSTRRLVACAALALAAGTSCILDLEGLAGGPRPRADGGLDAGAGTDGSGGLDGASAGDCPSRGGPTPVRITTGSSAFCIDATEVTNAQYAQFLDAGVSPSSQVAPCTDNTSFRPSDNWPDAPELPVVAVDWCDAVAFCTWAGKALCGKIGGGHLLSDQRNDATQSAWYFACSAGGTKPYPYGASFNPTACVTSGPLPPVGSKKTCEGGFPGVFDLTGSVEEWVDECTADFADCMARGGNHLDSQGWACTTEPVSAQARMLAERWRGFRCCSP